MKTRLPVIIIIGVLIAMLSVALYKQFIDNFDYFYYDGLYYTGGGASGSVDDFDDTSKLVHLTTICNTAPLSASNKSGDANKLPPGTKIYIDENRPHPYLYVFKDRLSYPYIKAPPPQVEKIIKEQGVPDIPIPSFEKYHEPVTRKEALDCAS